MSHASPAGTTESRGRKAAASLLCSDDEEAGAAGARRKGGDEVSEVTLRGKGALAGSE